MYQVFEPEIGQEEIDSVVDALKKGEISGSFGGYIPEFEEKFAAYCGAKYGVAVSSGTTALHLAVAAAGIKPGEEILMSACTNIATGLAAYHNGAVTVPVDSEGVTWNLNLDLVEDLITPKTRAILPVHIYGHPVDMDRLNKIAKKHNLIVIEDCAEAHGATVRGKKVGGLSDMGCFSFYANKIITTGEGGMVVTNSEEYAEKLRLLRNLAFTTPRFWHQHPGYNFRMTGMQAAMGVAQLQKIERVVEQKRAIAKNYDELLKDVEELQTPTELDWARNVYWMYTVRVRKGGKQVKDELLSYLKKNGVDTRTMFCPMNQQPFLREQPGYRPIDCPVADEMWETGFYLPSSNNLSRKDIESITQTIKQFFA